jgi:hypothetical protein
VPKTVCVVRNGFQRSQTRESSDRFPALPSASQIVERIGGSLDHGVPVAGGRLNGHVPHQESSVLRAKCTSRILARTMATTSARDFMGSSGGVGKQRKFYFRLFCISWNSSIPPQIFKSLFRIFRINNNLQLLICRRLSAYPGKRLASRNSRT